MKLAQRDKGEKNYEAWYAFGRWKATSDGGRRLLFPYMTDHPRFVYTDNENMLIYCGYAIFSENEEDLLVLKRILESSIFDYYMQHTSPPVFFPFMLFFFMALPPNTMIRPHVFWTVCW